MTPTPFADAALDYAERGWRVFKIPPGRKIPKDRWLHGSPWEIATLSRTEIAHRAVKYPRHNIGIATGGGLAVLDIDPQHGGLVPNWAPATLTARTPSGGAHLYYRVTGEVRNSAGVLGPGIDVRGEGGMVLAPPSQTDGGCYEWVNAHLWDEELNEGGTLAHVDARLLMPSGREGTQSPKRLTKQVFGEGDRHDAMLALAGTMRSKGCEEPEIGAALHALNKSRFVPVLEDEWVDKVVRSIMRYSPDADLLAV